MKVCMHDSMGRQVVGMVPLYSNDNLSKVRKRITRTLGIESGFEFVTAKHALGSTTEITTTTTETKTPSIKNGSSSDGDSAPQSVLLKELFVEAMPAVPLPAMIPIPTDSASKSPMLPNGKAHLSSKATQPVVLPQFMTATDKAMELGHTVEMDHSKLFHSFQKEYDQKITQYAQERRNIYQQRFETEVGGIETEGGAGGGEDYEHEVTLHSSTYKVGEKRVMLSFHVYQNDDGSIASNNLYIVGYYHRDGSTYECNAMELDWVHLGYGELTTLSEADAHELCVAIGHSMQLDQGSLTISKGKCAVDERTL
jgi:hypothetical protein